MGHVGLDVGEMRNTVSRKFYLESYPKTNMQIVNSYSTQTRGVRMCAGFMPLKMHSSVGFL
jgi:hypothetical protein